VETTSVGGRRLSQTVALRPEEHDGSPASTGDVGADGGGEDGRSGRVAFTASVEAPRRGPVMLALAAGQFETCTMPESVEQLWGPVFLPSLPAGVPNTCIVASHRSTRVIQVCVLSLDRYLLPAAAARTRAADSLSISPARAPELSSKPSARRCCCGLTGQTDGRTTDGRPLHRPCIGVLCRQRQ